jgi:hypothetical protein
MSFYSILPLIPYFFSILLLLAEKIKFEVGQLHFVCFPVHFENTIHVLMKLVSNFKTKLEQLFSNFFKSFKQNSKNLGYKRQNRIKTCFSVPKGGKGTLPPFLRNNKTHPLNKMKF